MSLQPTLPQSEPSPQDRTKEEENFESFEIDSELLLSRIEFEEAPPSPQINYSAAEAKIKELTETAEPPPKKNKPYCGCGQTYSCTSSLYLHIRSKHQGIPPANTIGGPKGIVKKPNPNWPTDPAVKLEEEVKPKPPPPPPKPQEAPGVRQEPKKLCRHCSKTYSCNSSLNLHLKRKHPNNCNTEEGRVEFSCRQEESSGHKFGCTLCELSYGSKSALGLHYNNRHSSKGVQGPFDNKVQQCGCGLVYQSRSALNMHVKKKHEGHYPEGTTEKANQRHPSQFRSQPSQGQEGRIDSYLGSEEEEERSIYDSESEGKSREQRASSKEQPEKPFRCGCGRGYSCSSSLNLHIKKNHNWEVPEGTIGGPRGMRSEEERPKQESAVEPPRAKRQCGKCQRILVGEYFLCRKQGQRVCCECFWGSNLGGSGEHDWAVEKE